MIYLGSDHAGFKLKEKIKKYFEKHSISYADIGALEFDSEDDYVDYAQKTALNVAKERNSRGILFCGSGNGMAIAANKIKGARAAVAWNKESAIKSVEHNHANMLAIPSRMVSSWRVIPIIKAWMKAKPSEATRHLRRIKKIAELEK